MDKNLGELEQLVLLALVRLGDDAYGVSVQEEIRVPLPRPRGDLGALRGTPQFAEARYQVWKALHAQDAVH